MSSKLCEFDMLIMVIREEADMVAVQKKVYNALATDLEAQRARLPCSEKLRKFIRFGGLRVS